MNDAIPLALLRRAWPDGYLNMQGVVTLHGDTCLGNGVWVEAESMASGPTCTVLPFEWRFSENTQTGPEDTEACLGLGYFLPDLSIESTFHCVKRDLANALGWPFYPNLGWYKMRQGFWRLSGTHMNEERQENGEYGGESFRNFVDEYQGWNFPDFEGNPDPLTALVQARVQVRESA